MQKRTKNTSENVIKQAKGPLIILLNFNLLCSRNKKKIGNHLVAFPRHSDLLPSGWTNNFVINEPGFCFVNDIRFGLHENLKNFSHKFTIEMTLPFDETFLFKEK